MTSKFHFKGLLRPLTVLLILAAAAISGCSRHPKATTRDSMDFIKQVYTACNTKNSKRLANHLKEEFDYWCS